ncbi:hypothetical protein [Anaerotignum propionicum]|uniref:hypothetical protein n=1 Tax=Anaerotignum propionicum TaxID=28446 RepID=UPI002109F058|nr:hypothetical protein [Anaerotignum propionicum]MCQ4934860.1 hypothetical protein [Anaerotignum propionicum]
MEKIIWVRSTEKTLGVKEDDGLDTVNRYLAEGWSVKHIAACAVGESLSRGQAYIVIEKK